MSMEKMPKFEAVTLEKLRFAKRIVLPLPGVDDVEMSIWLDESIQQVYVDITARILGRIVWTDSSYEDVEEVPATWIDALRARFWLVRRLAGAPRMRMICLRHTTNHYHVCPHVATDSHRSHALWMIRDCRDDLRIDR